MNVREVALRGRRVVRVVAYELNTGEAEPLRRVLIAPAWEGDPTLLGNRRCRWTWRGSLS